MSTNFPEFKKEYTMEWKKGTEQKKPIAGIRLQVPINRAPWRALIPVNLDLDASKIPELVDLLKIADVSTECILYPEYIYKGKKYTLHTCDYHEYIIIEWMPKSFGDYIRLIK